MRRGARPRQRSSSWRGRWRWCRCRSRTRARCCCGSDCRCNCRTRSHSRGESWRCTGCRCWSGRTHAKHVNKTSDYLLVRLVNGLHAGDEETTFVAVEDDRTTSWKLDSAGKHVHWVTELGSISRQELHPNRTGIGIGPSDQVNLVDWIERYRRGTSAALLGYREQGSCWFAGRGNKLPKERWRVKIGEHGQVLVR